MKNNKVLIPVTVLIIILIFASAYFFLSTRNKPAQYSDEMGILEEVIPTITPDEIGLEFTARSDKKYVKFSITKPEGIESVEYDILYDAVSNGNTVNQGLTGQLSKKDLKNGILETEWRELGTCSTGGKCRFDEGVKEVKLLAKIIKSNGKIFQVEKSLSLEEEE